MVSQLAFNNLRARAKDGTFRGGARPGAGRKKTGTRRDVLHRARASVSRHHPQHVTLRVCKDVPRLRQGKVYRAMRRALVRVLERVDFRVVHFSIQHNHLHFLVEAQDKRALELGMRALAITAAKAINKMCGRRGKVFEFRYHANAITAPRQARHALAYVLNNWRRHKEDERNLAAFETAVDPYSSARVFNGWREVKAAVLPAGFDPEDFAPLPVVMPETWLLTIGWKRHGEIGVREVPGPMQGVAR